MKVSLIIPTYNRCSYLLSVLRTVKNQNFDMHELEVIIADNGSTDGTLEALENFRCDFSLRVVNIPKENQFEAAKLRNQAVKYAFGEIYIFVDSDILLPKTFIQSHLCYYHSPDDLISVIGSVYYLENKEYPMEIESIFKTETLSIDPLESFYSANSECGVWNPLAWMMYHAGNVSMTRKAFELSGGFDEWHREWSIEDLDFGYQLQKNGVRLVYSKYAYGLHKWHESSQKNSASIHTGFQYLIDKEQNSPLIQFAYEDMLRMQQEQNEKIERTEFAKRLFFLNALKCSEQVFQKPDITVAIYSCGNSDSLYHLLDELEHQSVRRFEVLVIDDSDSIEKDAVLQTRNYSYLFRIFHVDWHKQEVSYLINRFQMKKFRNCTVLDKIDRMLLDLMEYNETLHTETLREMFETFVYQKALGNYVKLLNDDAVIGTQFIYYIYRDLLNKIKGDKSE